MGCIYHYDNKSYLGYFLEVAVIHYHPVCRCRYAFFLDGNKVHVVDSRTVLHYLRIAQEDAVDVFNGDRLMARTN